MIASDKLTGHEDGFSTVRMLFWLAVIGAAGWLTVAVADVYYTAWKVQDVFDTVAQNMSGRSTEEIAERLPVLYDLQGLEAADLPQEYYDNLKISTVRHGIRIFSKYHVTIWLLGTPEDAVFGQDRAEADLESLDKYQDMARLEFDFSPSAETH